MNSQLLFKHGYIRSAVSRDHDADDNFVGIKYWYRPVNILMKTITVEIKYDLSIKIWDGYIYFSNAYCNNKIELVFHTTSDTLALAQDKCDEKIKEISDTIRVSKQ